MAAPAPAPEASSPARVRRRKDTDSSPTAQKKARQASAAVESTPPATSSAPSGPTAPPLQEGLADPSRRVARRTSQSPHSADQDATARVVDAEAQAALSGAEDPASNPPSSPKLSDAKSRTLAKRLGEPHHSKLRALISSSLRTNVHVKKKVWYQEAHQFFQELPPAIQRGFANADELAKMARTKYYYSQSRSNRSYRGVYNDVIGATARWRRVMFARLNAGDNRAELVAKLANADYRQRVAFALAAIVLPPPHFLPTVQEIQRADLNLEQWLLE